MPLLTADNLAQYGDPHPRQRVAVLDTDMSYVDVGAGDPIVFLHGNPTWSYLWRNIIPHVLPHGRCLAPDLVGMGLSGKSPTRAYCFEDHARYLDAWFEAMGLTNVVLVTDDWGTALGAHWANRNRDRVQALVYMEGVVFPGSWDDYAGAGKDLFKALRSEPGEQMILEENLFIEGILPRTTLRTLGVEEMDAYRAPFATREDRWPTLAWPRELPIEGEPANVVKIIEASGAWLATEALPKLLIVGEPGAVLTGRALAYARTWANQREVSVPGIHSLQEDSPAEIGLALSLFLRELRPIT
ncbi:MULTISPECIES: haloalkane dehalogenase [unclassified Pseudomonas]|jgi:haloalkane dehalogenase|uniref:haloalkane dehalogenase n=1 Tax=unclassified Pseudomonas TaxID=196821 RepID=UPI00249BE9F2|nr:MULTISPECIES: haloalkane dehalogenase [unclassified Pseudomonas]MDI3251463.1 haloalkane dehalogenase [Pseudomonas sp. AL10]MDI3267439.1 haloalkane dehalogenase [Pseudomonas sp. AL15]